ncbi:MAG TPA: hypothetical protein VFJ58_06165 [Armatimonadota bacterium]|nr:hypothetical protein [Armatimonadota bacterium]
MGINLFSKTTACDRVAALLGQYSQEELPPSLFQEVERHIGVCEPCRKELAVTDGVIELLRKIDRPAPPPDLWQRIYHELNQPVHLSWPESLTRRFAFSGGRARRLGWLAPLAAVAAAAAIWLGAVGPHDSGAASAGIIVLPPASQQQVAPASYFSQAEQTAMFDPLADRASIGTILEASDRMPLYGPQQQFRGAVRIDNAMSGMSSGNAGQ